MTNLKDQYIVVRDNFVVYRGTFKQCVKWCREIQWCAEAYGELVITKVVADGKEV